MNTYTVITYGTIYKSSGPRYGQKGVIGGLTRDDVKSQIIHHKERGDSMSVIDSDGRRIPLAEFS